MHTFLSTPAAQPSAAAAVLSLARKLHRLATSDSLANSLPVLRRVLSSQTLAGLSLAQLWRQRAMVQRKHLLRTLAVEAGFPNWEHYCRELRQMRTEALAHFDVQQARAGQLNLWFSSAAQAKAHAREFGGCVASVGLQAVVLADGE